MKRTGASFVVLALSLALPSVSPRADRPAPAEAPTAVDTSSVLAPSDSGYVEAMRLARILEGHGFHIRRVGRSKCAGFMGEWRSASYLTDRGNFSVVFFPEPDGAEKVRITSEVKDDHYLYKYQTNQPGLMHEQKEDHDGPQFFVVRGRWFIFVWDGNTAMWLKLALPRA